MPEAMEEVYIGMLGLTDSIPVYDANQNRIKKEVVKILNAQVNKLGPCLREFHLFTTLIELDLMSNNLVDSDLETLRVSCTLHSLNLSNNDLKEVPLIVENGLRNLTKIILQGNPSLDITKCIQNLCGLKKLKHLDLSHTKITTIPEDIRKIQTLEELNISDTKILEGEIPVGVFSLKNLKVLITDEAFGRYEGSQLEELFEDQILENMDIHPTERGEIFWKYSRGHALKLMKKVKKMEVKKQWPIEGSTVLELWLNSSMLGSLGDQGVDDLFKNMRNIQSFKQITLLSLCTNDLYQIPNLRHFDNIRQLGLCRNNLRMIPAHVLSLPSLTNLYITDNKIETLVFNVEDFPALEELHLQGNPICRNYDAADACLESRKNLMHSQCAIQGLKEVMYRGSNLPRIEQDVEHVEEVGWSIIMDHVCSYVSISP
jgi:Leucine-rich repeat (LRR) protein